MNAKTASKIAIASLIVAITAAAGTAEARTVTTLPVIDAAARAATVETAAALGNADALAPNRDRDAGKDRTAAPQRLALRGLNPQPLPPR